MMSSVGTDGFEENPLPVTSVAADLPFEGATPDRQTSRLLLSMFRDSQALGAVDRRDLITQLRGAVETGPAAAEIRVLLGMVLYVDSQTEEALEQMREAVHRAPDYFIARLKLGEMLVGLQLYDQAAEETQKAAQLASDRAQSDLARRQAAAICDLLQQSGGRSGRKSLVSRVMPSRR